MPELPEVEMIKRSLAPLVGKTVARVWFSRVAPVETTTPAKITRFLRGQIITALARRGKYLIIRTDRPIGLVLHLGMSGKLSFLETLTPQPNHTHMEIFFSDGSRLRLVDPRRFGTISLTVCPDGSDNAFLRKLGFEYNDPTRTIEDFTAQFRRHPNLALKAALLHQGIIAGIGNIYACEALFRARLDPRRRVGETNDAELKRLLVAVRKTLELGIRWQGTTLRDYQDGRGTKGSMQKHLKVYGRANRSILRIVQNNRATWFHPILQR